MRPKIETDDRYCMKDACRRIKEKREHPKEKKVVDGKVSLVDRQAKLAGIDRGTRGGFMRYMEERPFYFRATFGRMTIAEAWGVVGGR